MKQGFRAKCFFGLIRPHWCDEKVLRKKNWGLYSNFLTFGQPKKTTFLGNFCTPVVFDVARKKPKIFFLTNFFLSYFCTVKQRWGGGSIHHLFFGSSTIPILRRTPPPTIQILICNPVLLGVAGIPGLWGLHGQLPLCSCVCEVAPRGVPRLSNSAPSAPIAFVGRIPRVAGRAPQIHDSRPGRLPGAELYVLTRQGRGKGEKGDPELLL